MAHIYRDLPAAGTILELMIGYTYTPIDGATDISWDGLKRGIRTPTLLTSPSVVKKPGMPDPGDVKCKVYYDPNDVIHQDLIQRLIESAAAASAAIDSWKLIYADGYATPSNVTFLGFVSDFSHAATDPETGTVTADMTVSVTSITAFTAGSPAE